MKHLYFNQNVKDQRFHNDTLENAKLIQSEIHSTQFINAIFSQSEIDHVTFHQCTFYDCAFADSSFRKVTFENCLFHNISFTEDLSFMEAQSVIFKNCLFINQELKGLPAQLRQTSLFESCEFKKETKTEVTLPIPKAVERTPPANRFEKLEFAG
jgi:uncharacterized protein YjbI with pentapeptide repeats